MNDNEEKLYFDNFYQFETEAKLILEKNGISGKIVGKNESRICGPKPLDLFLYEHDGNFFVMYNKNTIIKLRKNFMLPTIRKKVWKYKSKFVPEENEDITYEVYEIDDMFYFRISGKTIYRYYEHATKDEIVETVKRKADVKYCRLRKDGIVKNYTENTFWKIVREGLRPELEKFLKR